MAALPAIALLHGGGQGSWVWELLLPLLKRAGVPAFTLDVPGCGTKRGRDTALLNVADVAAELLADIDAGAGAARVILVGHSQAGTLLPVLAARAPARFARLVFLAACAPLPGQSVIEMMGRNVHGANPDEVGWPLDPACHDQSDIRRLAFANDMAPEQANAFLARLDADHWPMAVTLATDWDTAPGVATPASYVLCTQDGILPVAWQKRFAERLNCARIISLDAGHQAMLTRPQLLAELLLAELASA